MSAGADNAVRALQRIQRKLDIWELEHLRAHAAELAQQVEQLQKQIAGLEESVSHHSHQADWWREQCMQIEQQLSDDLSFGLSKDGALHIVNRESA